MDAETVAADPGNSASGTPKNLLQANNFESRSRQYVSNIAFTELMEMGTILAAQYVLQLINQTIIVGSSQIKVPFT